MLIAFPWHGGPHDGSTTWDGVGSSVLGGLIGGVLSGLVVVFGVWLAQQLQDRSEDEAERRRTARGLIPIVGNLRDAVLYSQRGQRGEFDLYPLRNALLEAAASIADTDAYAEASALLSQCTGYRDWLRAGYGGVAADLQLPQDYDPSFDADEFRTAFARHAEHVLNLLAAELTRTGSNSSAAYPRLPWSINPDDVPYDPR
ncbi:hypothetical protein [Pedococcus bigeumensis]|uniref:hypothetical protein n=1 Tax=Pedococcus bigeumensis TaxID=433644 RepID=UPI0031D96C27